jgi:hypothetical protein
MKLIDRKQRGTVAMSIVELTVAIGIGSAILAGFTVSCVAFQRSFVALEDYAKGQNDQMRISDYLSMDMRRAFSITISGSAAAPPLTVTMVVPNYYSSANSAYDPYITGVTGWPYKKHHHHKHQNVILQQVINYGPYNAGTHTATGASTKTVVYIFDNQNFRLYRCVDGAVPGQPGQPDPAGVTTIATDVKDFSVAVNDLDETAQTQITFQPRFKTVASPDAIAATTYYQTTGTRNTR